MKSTIIRAHIFYAFLVAGGLLAIGKMVYLQFISKSELNSDDLVYRVEKIDANRGSILAMDGRPLSASVPFFDIRMDLVVPSEQTFNSEVDSLAYQLSKLFGNKSSAQYKRELINARKKGNRYFKIGNRLLDYGEMLEIREFPIFRHGRLRGGLVIEERNRRNNPYGRLAYRTIGYINNQGVGVGLEKSYNYTLEGRPGQQTVKKLLGGEWVPVFDEKRVPPKDGSDIVTTINIEFQEAAERALKEQLALSEQLEGATAIVMEVKSGAIRAIANMKKGRGGTFDESYNYAIGHATEPGSTFKAVTLVTLLEDGALTLDSKVNVDSKTWRYKGASYSDVGGDEPPKTLLEAFEKSSNVAFARSTVEQYENNQKRFVERITATKITEKLSLDIDGAAQAVLYTPGEPMWSKVSLPSMAIGYSTLLTPMHMLSFYNAIANDGKMMRPYFVESIQSGGVVEKRVGPQEVSGSICSKRTVEQVKIALKGVVENGTGRALRDPRYSISGKTGTSRVAFDGGYTDSDGNRMYQASFAGFFPSEDPKYSIVVVLYTGKTKRNFYGSSWAGPVFKKIADEIYATSIEWLPPIDRKGEKREEYTIVQPGNVEATKYVTAKLFNSRYSKRENQWMAQDSSGTLSTLTAWESEELPNVEGMGLKDAIYILENRGCRVKFSGRGRVLSQEPKAGTPLNRVEEVKLILE